jgi:hypothetical protein
MKMTKNRLFLLALVLIASSAALTAKKSKEFQVVFSLAPQAWSTYAANVGAFITNGFTDYTQFGSFYTMSALLLPKNTIDTKHQNSFLTDRYGNVITPASAIGTWTSQATRVVDFDYFNLPASGTVYEQYSETFSFYGNRVNNVYAVGESIVQSLSNGLLNKRYSAVVGGYGKNDDIDGQLKEETYIAPDGQSMVMICKFQESVEY